MKGPIVGLVDMWQAEWWLTAFLVLLATFVFVLNPVIALTPFRIQGQPVITFFFSLILIAGILSVTGSPVVKFVGIVLVAATILFHWLQHLVHGTAMAALSAVFSILGLGFMCGVVLFQTFKKGPITMHRIQGAVAVYLMLGLVWSFAYDLVELQSPGSFQAANPMLPHGALLYFSFTTLTTVGYGDITPVHPVARSLVNLEQLVGQLFPVILIGRMVAMELESKLRRREP